MDHTAGGASDLRLRYCRGTGRSRYAAMLQGCVLGCRRSALTAVPSCALQLPVLKWIEHVAASHNHERGEAGARHQQSLRENGGRHLPPFPAAEHSAGPHARWSRGMPWHPYSTMGRARHHRTSSPADAAAQHQLRRHRSIFLDWRSLEPNVRMRGSNGASISVASTGCRSLGDLDGGGTALCVADPIVDQLINRITILY